MPTSLGGLCPVSWSSQASRRPQGMGKAGPAGWVRAAAHADTPARSPGPASRCSCACAPPPPPTLTPLLGVQAPPLDARAPAHPPRTAAPCCSPHGRRPLPGALPESPTHRCSDRRPWAPAPCSEPPAFTGWPVAQGKGLRTDVGGALGASVTHLSCPQVAVRWEKTQVQLLLDGVQALGQAEPGPQHRGVEGPRPHTLFVGGLPVRSHRPKLPVRTLSSASLPCPQPSQYSPFSSALLGPDPVSSRTGGRQQLPVQWLCEETGAGRTAPEGPHPSGGRHALLVRPGGDRAVLRRQRGSHHHRSASRAGEGAAVPMEGGAGAPPPSAHSPSPQTPWGPPCLTSAWNWRCGPRQPPASSSTWGGSTHPHTCGCRCWRSR